MIQLIMPLENDTRFNKITQWSLQYFVVPLSGWNNDFDYIGKGPRFIKLPFK